MMMWYGGNGGWVGWLLMTLAMIVFWALLITALVALVRYLVSSSRGTGVTSLPGPGSAEDVLAQRYAHGEIDDDEYQRRLGVIRQNRSA
jgi:putative membrane protein